MSVGYWFALLAFFVLVALFVGYTWGKRKDISEASLSWKSIVLKFKQEEQKEATEKAKEEISAEETQPNIKWERTGDLFWLGNDIMYTKSLLILGAPREYVITSLQDSLVWARNLGFQNTYADTKLLQYVDFVKNNEDFDRRDLFNNLEIVKEYIASRAEENQVKSN